MTSKNHFFNYYFKHRIPNPVNFTLTQKQTVEGKWIDDQISEQNFRHFRNVLNKQLFGNQYCRYGKGLKMFVIRESDTRHRHHLHGVIEKPDNMDSDDFIELVKSIWSKTKYGYLHTHFEEPSTIEREIGWIDYCLKERTKIDLSSSIDWVNSTCFELC